MVQAHTKADFQLLNHNDWTKDGLWVKRVSSLDAKPHIIDCFKADSNISSRKNFSRATFWNWWNIKNWEEVRWKSSFCVPWWEKSFEKLSWHLNVRSMQMDIRFFSPSLSFPLPLLLSLTQSFSLAHTQTNFLSYALFHTLTLTSHPHILNSSTYLSHAYTHSLSLSHAQSLQQLFLCWNDKLWQHFQTFISKTKKFSEW